MGRRVFIVVRHSRGYGDLFFIEERTPLMAFTERAAAEEYLRQAEEEVSDTYMSYDVVEAEASD